MKKTFLLLIFCSIVLQCLATSNKEYRKIARKYDVPEEAIDLDSDDPSDFWNIIINKNERYQKFLKDIKKNKGAEKEALSEMQNMIVFDPLFNPYILEDWQGFCDTLLMEMGVLDIGVKCTLHIIESSEINAYTATTNYGFAILVTTGLIRKEGCSLKILMAVVAHELAHGIYQHQLQHLYAQAKKKRKNELLTGIFQGITMASAGVSAYYSAGSGVEFDSKPYEDIIYGIKDRFDINTRDYFFVYGREEEYEADIVAFRFMRFMGYGDAFISALRFLGDSNDRYYSKFSEHPKTEDRINLLEYMIVYPEEITKSNKNQDAQYKLNEEYVKEIYEFLSPKYNLGDFDFYKDNMLNNDEAAKEVYEFLVREGFDASDYNTFIKTLRHKVK